MRGGSRYGAGRPAYKCKCEHSLSLDIRDLWRRGLIRAGNTFGWSWYQGSDDPAASIRIQVPEPADRITLHFSNTSTGQSFCMPICLGMTPCSFGGRRTWLQCPVCGRKAAKVYYRHQRWACRTCQRLAYASQSEDRIGRIHRQRGKLEKRIGEDGKPKGMHWCTYERLQGKYFRHEEILDNMLADYLSKWPLNL